MKSLIQNSLEDGKANDVVNIDLHGKTDIADCMVIASGTSNKHTSFLAEKLIERINQADPESLVAAEGVEDGNWVLVYTGDVIVHIFKADVRQMYNLEKMWAVPAPVEESAPELALV